MQSFIYSVTRFRTCELTRTATHCNTLQHTATHNNTLQHTATHCNILQHTGTQWIRPSHAVVHLLCKPIPDARPRHVYAADVPCAHELAHALGTQASRLPRSQYTMHSRTHEFTNSFASWSTNSSLNYLLMNFSLTHLLTNPVHRTQDDSEFVIPLMLERFDLEQLARLDCVSPPFIGERPVQFAHIPWRHDSKVDLEPSDNFSFENYM